MIKARTSSVAVLIGACATVGAQTPAVPCNEVFIQDYEYDDGGAMFRMFTPCPGDDLQGAPAYPVQQKKVHKEYVRGDWYAMQVSYEWHWDSANRADCVHITRRVTRSYVRVEGGVEQSARVDHEGVTRSRDTGENYRGSFVAGGGAKARVPRDAPQARAESTRFGIQCLRLGPVSPLAALGDACLPILAAPRCKAELHLMPIEVISAPGDGIRLAGRTTRLELLPNDTVLDRAGWVMP